MISEPCIALLYPSAIHGSPRRLAADVARFRAAQPGADVLECFDRLSASWTADDEQWLGRVEIAVVLGDPGVLIGRAPHLTWVQSVTTGVDHIDTAALAEAGICITTAAGTASPEIAEFVVARMLEHWKRLPEIEQAQRERRWGPIHGRPMTDSRVVLVGYGAINRSVAALLAPFRVRLTAVRRRSDLDTPGVHEVVALEELDDALADADAVLVALPSTPATDGLFDAARFARMPRGAFFCNVGRGSAVVEPALGAALSSGHLGGAALDVTVREPLPADDAIWGSGARISPHSSSVPHVAIARVLDLVVENLERIAGGRPMRNEVAGGL